MYLFTAAPADSSSEVDAGPQRVSLLEEAGKPLPPVLAQCPWKNLIFNLLLILLHGVGEITRDWEKCQKKMKSGFPKAEYVHSVSFCTQLRDTQSQRCKDTRKYWHIRSWKNLDSIFFTRFTLNEKKTRYKSRIPIFFFKTYSAMNKFFLVYSAIVKWARLKYTKVMARRYCGIREKTLGVS